MKTAWSVLGNYLFLDQISFSHDVSHLLNTTLSCYHSLNVFNNSKNCSSFAAYFLYTPFNAKGTPFMKQLFISIKYLNDLKKYKTGQSYHWWDCVYKALPLNMKRTVSQEVTPCGSVEILWYFRETCNLHFEIQKVSQGNSKVSLLFRA